MDDLSLAKGMLGAPISLLHAVGQTQELVSPFMKERALVEKLGVPSPLKDAVRPGLFDRLVWSEAAALSQGPQVGTLENGSREPSRQCDPGGIMMCSWIRE